MKQFALDLHHDRVRIAESTLPAPVLTYDVDEETWRLEEPYTYQDAPNAIIVPAQFKFDLASVPRAFWWLIAPFELSISAPLIHDFLYRYGGDPPDGTIFPPRTYSRKEADILFREIMRKEGVWAWRWFAAYHAVRLFGGARWRT